MFLSVHSYAPFHSVIVDCGTLEYLKIRLSSVESRTPLAQCVSNEILVKDYRASMAFSTISLSRDTSL